MDKIGIKPTPRNHAQYNLNGSHDIHPLRDWTHFLKIGFMVAGGEFNSYCIHQGNKSDKEMKIVKKVKFYAYKMI